MKTFRVTKVVSCNDTTTILPPDGMKFQVELVLVTDNAEKLTLLFSQAAVGQMKPHCKIFENSPT